MRPAAGRAPRLNEQVASELERRIAAGLLGPGTPLSEIRLAEEFGISRAPVRGALHRLEQSGLVRRSGSRRSYVVVRRPDGTAAPVMIVAPAEPAKVSATASWEGIYRDVSRKAVARAAFGSWRITETELAAHYGVSRTVAREVLGRLDHIGIIRKDSRSRWYLPALTPQRVGELYEMRRVLEPIALRKAAASVPRAMLAAMRAELESAGERPELTPAEAFDRMERQLHVDLLSYADHTTLLETLQHYHALLVANAYLYESTRGPAGPDPFIEEHLAVVRALDAGRVEQAADALEKHLEVASGRVLRRIGSVVDTGHLEPLRYLTPITENQTAPSLGE